MFSYCNNNSVNARDESGEFLCTLIGGVVGAVCSAFASWAAGGSGYEILAAAASGGISGACAGLAADIIMVTGGTALAVGISVVAAGALGNASGKMVERNIISRYEGTPADNSWNTVQNDLYVGALTSLPFAMCAEPVKPMMKAITEIAGKKALERGITFSYAATRTIRREWNNLFNSIGNEVLQNIGSWIIEPFSELAVAKVME